MTDLSELGGIVQQQSDIELSPQRYELQREESQEGPSFSDMLANAVKSVDETMKASDQKVQNLVAGETEDLHDVMVSMKRAQLSFQLMVEMRNKAIETYQEISRMQI